MEKLGNITLDKRLSHLSLEEIMNICEMYADKKIKVTEIVELYKIPIAPSHFFRIIPPALKTDKMCKFCGENLYEKPARNFYNDSDKICINCGHREPYYSWDNCKCDNCVAEREYAEKEKERIKRQIVENKKEIVRNTYSKMLKPISFKSLSKYEKIRFLYIYKNIFEENGTEIMKGSNLIEKISAEGFFFLLDNKFLVIDPESSIDAFEDEGFPLKVRYKRANYLSMVTFEDNEIDLIKQHKYFREILFYEEIEELVMNCLYDEVISYFKRECKKRNIDPHISEKTEEEFKDKMLGLNYGQIIGIIFRSVRAISDKLVQKEITQHYAENAALKYCINHFDFINSRGWSIDAYKFEYYNFSKFTRFVIGYCLDKDVTELFSNPINKVNFESCHRADGTIDDCSDIDSLSVDEMFDFDMRE
ncbi:MAG: hypothetical protein Q4C49_06100 [Bacillota bacterium]|nr:hypothetical protein [Bacillota bacterium]